MQIGVSYSDPVQQIWLTVEVPDDASVRSVIDTSGILNMFPNIDIETQKVGIFGRLTTLDAVPKPGDRIEIYRPRVCDPRTVRRRDGSVVEDE
jgi:uncharacterized protein